MTNVTKIKIYKVDSHHTIYLPKDFINDSSFPFVAGQELTARIDGKRVIIEKAGVLENEN